jgi:phosphohistidine phosphatase
MGGTGAANDPQLYDQMHERREGTPLVRKAPFEHVVTPRGSNGAPEWDTVWVRRLHLLRHAKSSWDDDALRDRDRPLAPRGRRASKRIASWARKHDVRPQLVVSSSAVRARETLRGVLPGLGEPEVWIEVALYAASAETLLERVHALPDEAEEAMLIGHNPGLGDLLLLLAAPGELRERAEAKVPTGALATLEADIERWADLEPGGAQVVSFVVPRQLK